jgi:hypothetical protein
MGSSLRETSAQYAHIQEAARGKKRAEEEARVSQQATPIGIDFSEKERIEYAARLMFQS